MVSPLRYRHLCNLFYWVDDGVFSPLLSLVLTTLDRTAVDHGRQCELPPYALAPFLNFHTETGQKKFERESPSSSYGAVSCFCLLLFPGLCLGFSFHYMRPNNQGRRTSG